MLQSMQLPKESFSVINVISTSEMRFLDKFVYKYGESSGLYELYKGMDGTVCSPDLQVKKGECNKIEHQLSRWRQPAALTNKLYRNLERMSRTSRNEHDDLETNCVDELATKMEQSFETTCVEAKKTQDKLAVESGAIFTSNILPTTILLNVLVQGKIIKNLS
eukprot:Gb_03685 [translate_table: standard]